ncbi:transcriptional regulator, AraC family [Zobellia uliginosa]|uniref:Transcriptional regulator, AraC family n=1 Tax=Zobellia uliginosa TaxID=143224 RepID=A0ABY1L1Q4_9FLAO|nr:GyrI-like domain-containing protein [Zobellia uliginosa]SIT11968.1 transcriptional regulator, AraC family [Zobellia uliginosa]
MNESIQERSFKEYVFRINKVIDFIRLNIEREISLDELAEVSNFSKFHFHRVFKAITGVTPNNFITKSKLGRAEYILANNLDIAISDIAYLLGFSSVSSFSKAFKKLNKLSPSQWRERRRYKNSKTGKVKSKIGQLPRINDNYIAPILLNQNFTNMELKKRINIEVKELENLPVIYIRNHSIHVHDSDNFAKMLNTLITWATPRELVDFPTTKALTVYRSMPDSKGMVQADVCLSVPEKTEGEGTIGKTVIKGGKYVVLHKEGTLDECFSAWDYLYNEWFPNSGYQPDDRGVYLNHLNDPKTHPQGLHIFDMCISVKPL